MLHSITALILIGAFALPSAAEALGLAEIHVNSALNEPLAAEVAIVGARDIGQADNSDWRLAPSGERRRRNSVVDVTHQLGNDYEKKKAFKR